MNKIRKTPVGLDCPIVLSEEFIAVGDDNVCTATIMADKDVLEFVEISKNIMDTGSDDENELNNVAPLSLSLSLSLFSHHEERHEKYAQLFRRTFQW
ncbi:hypothetical protein TNCV_4681581 [Trichonephila clavipes]|nr:hypothetical protein TNCV_4681581 [Trichonephila clavipes]